jgi:hydrogenase/urease accessory protein HupE
MATVPTRVAPITGLKLCCKSCVPQVGLIDSPKRGFSDMASTRLTPYWLTLAFSVAAAMLSPASAHEIRPAVVTAMIAPQGSYGVVVALNLEALLAGIAPEHRDTNDAPETARYNELRRLSPDELRANFLSFSARWLEGVRLELDGQRVRPQISEVSVPQAGDLSQARISKLHIAGTTPTGVKTVRWTYAPEFGSSVVRIVRKNQDTLELGWLKGGQSSGLVSLQNEAGKSHLQKFLNYIGVGFSHILPHGLDHILFVVGLYLLGAAWRPLLAQVTAFTVAHSITLALGLYGYVAVPSSVVEPLIALSIVYVAVENIFTSKLQVWRPFVVFCFGLLHGLGFASVLQEIGLPQHDYLVGLIGFNVGVEFGQLAVILLAFVASGLWFRNKPWYRRRIVWPASAAIALVGMFWTIERIWQS